MTVIEMLVEELKKRSIDLTLWHSDLLSKAFEMDNHLIKTAYNEGYEKGLKDGGELKLKDVNLSKKGETLINECQCFRLGEGSPWQTYLCEIHKENKIK